jgi:hypothetical protein
MTERQQTAFRLFRAAGYSPEGAAALVGNFSQESGVNLHSGYTVKTDHGSQGIAQWRLDRLTHLEEFCEARGLHSGTLAAQVQFAIYELGTEYPTLDALLRKGGDLDLLTTMICNKYERPAKQFANIPNRIKQARITLNEAKIATGAVVATGGVAAGSGLAAVIAYLQSGPSAGVIIAIGVMVLLGVAYLVASRKRPAAKGDGDDVEPTLIGEGETILAELQRAQDDLAAAQARVEDLKTRMLAHIKECQEAIGA